MITSCFYFLREGGRFQKGFSHLFHRHQLFFGCSPNRSPKCSSCFPSRTHDRYPGKFFPTLNSSRGTCRFPPPPRTTSPSASIHFKTTKVRFDPKKGLVVGKGRVGAKQPDVGKRGKKQGRAGEFPTSVSKGGKHPFTKGYQNVGLPTFLHEKWKR